MCEQSAPSKQNKKTGVVEKEIYKQCDSVLVYIPIIDYRAHKMTGEKTQQVACECI